MKKLKVGAINNSQQNPEAAVANAIRSGDFKAYQDARYPAIEDGDPLVFTGENFSNVDFDQYSMGFGEFHDCTLDGARRLYGQPITIKGGSAKEIDMRDIHTVIHASDCDFTGMLYNDETQLAGKEPGDVRSSFTNCMVDADTRRHFTEQGVIFTETAKE